MDLQVVKLDKAFATSENMNNKTVQTSKELSQDMNKILHSMMEHWKGDDATLHINEWIDKYERLGDYFSELSKITTYLQNYFVNLQLCRSRVTNNSQIGESVKEQYEFDLIDKIDATSEYYYNEDLIKDLSQLEGICNKYDQFIDNLDNSMNEIFQNWKIGIGREMLNNYYQSIERFSQKLSQELHKQSNKLTTVIQNIDKIS